MSFQAFTSHEVPPSFCAVAQF